MRSSITSPEAKETYQVQIHLREIQCIYEQNQTVTVTYLGPHNAMVKKVSDNVTSTNIQIIALYNQFQIKTIAIPLVTSNSVVSSSKWGIIKIYCIRTVCCQTIVKTRIQVDSN